MSSNDPIVWAATGPVFPWEAVVVGTRVVLPVPEREVPTSFAAGIVEEAAEWGVELAVDEVRHTDITVRVVEGAPPAPDDPPEGDQPTTNWQAEEYDELLRLLDQARPALTAASLGGAMHDNEARKLHDMSSEVAWIRRAVLERRKILFGDPEETP